MAHSIRGLVCSRGLLILGSNDLGIRWTTGSICQAEHRHFHKRKLEIK